MVAPVSPVALIIAITMMLLFNVMIKQVASTQKAVCSTFYVYPKLRTDIFRISRRTPWPVSCKQEMTI